MVGVASAVAIAGLVAGKGRGFVLTAVVWLPLLAAAFVRVGAGPRWSGRPQPCSIGEDARPARPSIEPPSPGRARRDRWRWAGTGLRLRFHIDDASGAAMIHDPHRHTLTAVVSVSHPAFVLLDRDDRAQRVSRWGRVFAGLAQSGTCAALQVLEADVPDPGDGLVDWYHAHGRGRAGWADQQYRALLDQARLGSSTHRTTISVALDLEAAARAVKAAGGGIPGAAAVLRQDMASLADALRQSGLTVGSWLARPNSPPSIRSAYDPAIVLDPRRDPGANLAGAGPLAISETLGPPAPRLGLVRVLWISRMAPHRRAPRLPPPAGLRPRGAPHPVHHRPAPARAMPRCARSARRRPRRSPTRPRRPGSARSPTSSDAQEYQDLLDRERSVIAGHTDVEFTGLITVTAPTRPARRRPGGHQPGRRPRPPARSAPSTAAKPKASSSPPCPWPAAPSDAPPQRAPEPIKWGQPSPGGRRRSSTPVASRRRPAPTAATAAGYPFGDGERSAPGRLRRRAATAGPCASTSCGPPASSNSTTAAG